MSYTEYRKETVLIDNIESTGFEYMVEVEVAETCIRRGTYSSAALDPDEYYGEWAVHGEVIGATVTDWNTEEGVETWVEGEDLPDYIVVDALYEAGVEV